MGAISGWGGRVRVGGVNGVALPVTRWTVTERTELPEVTTMEHYGQGSYAVGVRDWDVSFDCFWETALNPLTGATNVIPGNAGSYLQSSLNSVVLDLFMDKSSATRVWTFNNVIVSDVATDSDVRGVVKYSVTGKGTALTTFGGAAPTATSAVSLRPSGT